MTHIQDPCFPVGYWFPASIPLFMEDYNIHTTHFRIPQWFPPNVLPMMYHSRFENTQHLD